MCCWANSSTAGDPLKTAAALLVALVNLAEAEGRTLRRQIGRAGLGLCLLALAGAGAAAGFGFALWAAFLFLRDALGPTAGAAICGLFSLSLAGALAWTARRLTR